VPFPLNDVAPPELRDYVFDFVWDMDRLHAMRLPEKTLPVSTLAMHLLLPYWQLNGRPFQLTPQDVLDSPERYVEQYRRTWQADLRCPIVVCERREKPPMILDGVHRLLEAVLLGQTTIRARMFALEFVPQILPA
jgi:hypothetical protein